MTVAVLLTELVLAVALSAATVALSIRVAQRYAVVDRPDGTRKQQQLPIPRLGGVAVAVAFAAVTVVAVLVSDRAALLPGLVGVLVPAVAIAVLGAWDDARELGAWPRLAVQGLVAATAYALGTRITLTGFPLVDAALTVAFVVVVVNGVNLLDNSDGLAAATVLISAAGATVIAVILGQALVALMGCALIGVCLGFLWHNWFPARVYLGDAGAYLLGYLLAVLVIRLRPEELSPLAGVAVALLLVALPLADTAFVVIRRLRAGVHPFTAGRDHLSHRLQDRGRSVPASVLTLQVVPSIAAVGALILATVAT